MIKIISDISTIEFQQNSKITLRKKFESIPKNFIGKYDAALIRDGSNVLLMDNFTLISENENIDIIITGKIYEVKKGFTSEDKKVYKQIKKINRHFKRLFQFGLTPQEMELTIEAATALVKYRLLKKHNLSIDKEVNNA